MCLRCAKGTSIEPRIKRMGCDAPPICPFHPHPDPLPSRERGHPHPTEHRVRSLRYASPWIIVNISRLAFMVLRLIIDR